VGTVRVAKRRCGQKQRGKCLECRGERSDGDTAGQQADDAVEHGEAGGGGGEGGGRGSGRAHPEGTQEVRAQPQEEQVQGLRGCQHLRE
jgi:hypothetical protein